MTNKGQEKYKLKTILFVGNYPNTIEPTLNCFYQTLIYSIAELGYNCIVISPVSITHYKKEINNIPAEATEKTPKGYEIKVYFPKYISYSAKQIGRIKTKRISEKSYQQVVQKTVRKKKIHFDYSYGHFFLNGGLAAVKIGKKHDKPSFIAFGESSYEDCVSKPYGELTSRDLDGITGIISVSTSNKNILLSKELFQKIPILVAPNGTDAAIMQDRDKTECRRILNMPQDKFIVGFVGSLEERKGDRRLLEAVKQTNDVYVAFAGQGDKHVSEKVVFCEPVRREKLPLFLHAVDIFCLPTLSEGCCNAIVEALASGLPVISSDLPFNDDILDEKNSIRINPNSIGEIGEAIALLRDDRIIREGLALGAKQSANNLTIEKRAEKIIAFIEKNK